MSGHETIVRAAEIEDPEPWSYSPHYEAMGFDADYSRHFGFQRLGIHHQRLLPGRRTSFPHAESTEDEFIHVLSGTPDVWLDGVLHRLCPGDSVGFRAGTGLSHSFLNNTDGEVELLVVGDKTRADNRIVYPLNLERRAAHEYWWDDAPQHDLGPHDGMTDARRAELTQR